MCSTKGINGLKAVTGFPGASSSTSRAATVQKNSYSSVADVRTDADVSTPDVQPTAPVEGNVSLGAKRKRKAVTGLDL